MRINRRGALGLLGLGGGASLAGAAQATKIASVGYDHGVASGDPLQDRAIFWTRVTYRGGIGSSIAGKLLIGRTPDLKGARSVDVVSSADRDWTVKADVDGLKPGTDYYYRFQFDGHLSPVGRTRTLPDGPTRDVVLAVASCALYPQGHFNAYGAIAALDRVDVVIHLGDYIYEYGGAPGQYGMKSPIAQQRLPVPLNECLTLADYRARHGQYKADPQLQAAHARAPWIVVWDDHEVANDSWVGGAENHNPDKGEGDWAARKAGALKAYYEWTPLRDPAPGNLLESSYRTFRFGDLASLMMVETRLGGRDRQLDYDEPDVLPIVDGKPDIAHFDKLWRDPARRMMAERQEQWLAGELDRSVKAGEVWQLIGNQVVMARIAAPDFEAVMGKTAWDDLLTHSPEGTRQAMQKAAAMSALGLPATLDGWDGYPAARERLYDMFKAANAHPVVLSGDSHAFWSNELWDDAHKTRVAAEFGATSVTSPGFGERMTDLPLNDAFVKRNVEVKFVDAAAKGFVLLTVAHDEVKADLIAVSTIYEPAYTTRTLKTFTVKPAAGAGVEALIEV